MENREISEFTTGNRLKDINMAKREAMLRFFSETGISREEEAVVLGYRSYEIDLSGHEYPTRAFWIGKQSNEEGFNVRGGLLDQKYFSMGAKFTTYENHVISEPITWEETVDLLYNNIMNRSKENEAGEE